MTRRYEPINTSARYLVQARSMTSRDSYPAATAADALGRALEIVHSGQHVVILSLDEGFITVDRLHAQAALEQLDTAVDPNNT